MKWDGQSRNRARHVRVSQIPLISLKLAPLWAFGSLFSLDLPSDPKVSWFYVKIQANCRQGEPDAETICRARNLPSGFIQTHFRARKIPVPTSVYTLSIPPSHIIPCPVPLYPADQTRHLSRP